MSDITRILERVQEGDPSAASELLPLVYDELRKLAAQKLAQEKPGQTLQGTALVHEAYLRLAGGARDVQWANRRHFFAAAAEAMRRLLIDAARRKQAEVHGGGLQRFDLDDADLFIHSPPDRLCALDDALTKLETEDPQAANLVKLLLFAGLGPDEAACGRRLDGAAARTGQAGRRTQALRRDWSQIVQGVGEN